MACSGVTGAVGHWASHCAVRAGSCDVRVACWPITQGAA